MQEKFDESTPPSSPRTSPRTCEEQKLRAEANGKYAPAKPGSIFEYNRTLLIEKYVEAGLLKYDEQENHETDNLNQQTPGKGYA